MTSHANKPSTYPFTLTPLPFAYDALEPFIDASTMRIHHDNHHQAYITKLNAALKPHPGFHDLTIDELLQKLDELPRSARQAVYDQGGGHLHHQLFWKILKPATAAVVPVGRLGQMITRDFGSFSEFKKKFVEAGTQHFGSGWVFLALDATGQLEIFCRPDHNNIILESKSILLINDLWEHAYYLKYTSKRADYLDAFWNVVNWEYVSQRLKALHTTQEPLLLED